MGTCGPACSRGRTNNNTPARFASAKPHLLLYAGVIIVAPCSSFSLRLVLIQQSCSAGLAQIRYGAGASVKPGVYGSWRDFCNLMFTRLCPFRVRRRPPCPPDRQLPEQGINGDAAMIWLVATVAFVCSDKLSPRTAVLAAERHAFTSPGDPSLRDIEIWSRSKRVICHASHSPDITESPSGGAKAGDDRYHW
jgi:hypothetical protein